MQLPAHDVNRTIDAVWRIESARLIAGLARIVRDVGVAEDLAQDALVAALEQWPSPASRTTRAPGSWRRRSIGRSTVSAEARCTSERRGSSVRRSRSTEKSRVRILRPGSTMRRRRPPAPNLHRLPPRALDRWARRAHAAPARRPDDGRSRARIWSPSRPSRNGSCARSARSQRRECRSKCPAR